MFLTLLPYSLKLALITGTILLFTCSTESLEFKYLENLLQEMMSTYPNKAGVLCLQYTNYCEVWCCNTCLLLLLLLLSYINTFVRPSVTVQRSIGNAHACHSWQHANSKHARKEGRIEPLSQVLKFLAMDLTQQ